MDNRLSVALLFGGRSVEHEISNRSAANILHQLTVCGYHVLPIGITRDGTWYLQDYKQIGSCDPLPIIIDERHQVCIQPGKGLALSYSGERIPVDICFPVTHGSGGEDGLLQGLLELARLPYVGSGPLASTLGMHKNLAKLMAAHSKIPVVEGMTVHRLPDEDHVEQCTETIRSSLGESIIVKPEDGGSSIGVVSLPRYTAEELIAALIHAFSFSETVLVERLLDDIVELESAVVTDDELYYASEPGMVIDPCRTDGGFLTYEQKYRAQQGAYLSIPASVPRTIIDNVSLWAKTIAESLFVRGFARVDFFYQPKTGELWFNEINTIPGMTQQSHFPLLAASMGYDWDRLLPLLLANGYKNHEKREALVRTLRDKP